MKPSVPPNALLCATVAIALLYAISNGFRGAATIAATVVSTRALTPSVAFALCAVAEFVGAFLMGAAVASTMSKTVLTDNFAASPQDLAAMLCAALGVALAWGRICWWRGWPTSSGQALLAGLVGAALAIWGPSHVRVRLSLMVFLILLVSPLLGFFVAIAVTAVLRWIGERLTSRVRGIANACHVLSCLGVAAAHGSNEGQLAVGVLLPLVGLFGIHAGAVRFFIALALSLGVLVGGQQMLKKISLKFYRIRDPQGLGAELTSATTIFACEIFGFPASTNQVVAGSIVGAGVAQNARRVKWDFAQEMVLSWVVTFPVVSLLAFLAGAALREGGF
jgi:PiT family inorganic phosphate transporter